MMIASTDKAHTYRSIITKSGKFDGQPKSQDLGVYALVKHL